MNSLFILFIPTDYKHWQSRLFVLIRRKINFGFTSECIVFVRKYECCNLIIILYSGAVNFPLGNSYTLRTESYSRFVQGGQIIMQGAVSRKVFVVDTCNKNCYD